MRQLMLPLLLISLATACSQNPHLEVKDPAKVVTANAIATAPVKNLVPGDRDKDGVLDDQDLCVAVPGPIENKGCPYKIDEDFDKDGVLNEADRCPYLPGPVTNNGCPLTGGTCSYDSSEDFDQDGVPNTDDRCPAIKGPMENHGCPYEDDQDQDGVPDSEDRCPTVLGQVYNDGCPITDSDGDGVWDHIDLCPKVPGPATNRGCPIANDNDSDGDTIPDSQDKCPLVPGPVANDGCPIQESDSDRDGVPDSYDMCPGIPGPAANNGCPYPKEEERKVLVEAMASLKFDFDKAVIKDSSYPSLEKLANFLRKYPGATLKMVGHTDEVGTEEYNIQLSRARVEAVRDYLVSQNILPERTTIDARGESEPLVSVEGKEGDELAKAQAKNRRVDMSVSYVKVTRQIVRRTR